MPHLGKDATVNLCGGTFESPTLTPMANVVNANFTCPRAQADASVRGSDWKKIKTSLRDLTIKLSLLYEAGDAGFEALLAAWEDNEPIELAILNGPHDEAGSQGPHADYHVTNCEDKEDLEGNIMYDFELKPAKTTHEPEWLEIDG